MYALNLNSDNRILSACVVLPTTPADLPRVDTLPDGDINDWMFIDGQYVYDPLPAPPVPDKLTASTKVAPDEYFSIGGRIYKATTTIPAGDTVIPGTNCVSVNMTDILNSMQ